MMRNGHQRYRAGFKEEWNGHISKMYAGRVLRDTNLQMEYLWLDDQKRRNGSSQRITGSPFQGRRIFKFK